MVVGVAAECLALSLAFEGGGKVAVETFEERLTDLAEGLRR
jgi:hypothetical protein